MGRRRGGCVLMALGIVLALIGGGAAFYIVSTTINRPPPVEVPKKSIVVAKTNIPERTQLNPSFYDKVDWPVPLIPPDAIPGTAAPGPAAAPNFANLTGQFTTELIRQGQPILAKQVVTGTLISYSTYPWPQGKVLVAVPFGRANDLMGAGVLKEGVTVDLILNIAGGAAAGPGGQYVLGMQGLKIFAIGQLNKPPPVVDKEGKVVEQAPATKSTLFLFNVTPEDALTLKFMADLNPDFWVRSPLESDTQQFTVPVVNGAYVAQRFRLPAVPGTTGAAAGPPGGQPGGPPGQPGAPGQPPR